MNSEEITEENKDETYQNPNQKGSKFGEVSDDDEQPLIKKSKSNV